MNRSCPETALLKAIKAQELILHFQPRCCSVSGAVVALEALVRWQHPTRGLLGPDSFIPQAEADGTIVPMGAWVLKRACEQAMLLHREGWAVRMAVNVSPAQLRALLSQDLVPRVLADTGLAARFLELELTESMTAQRLDPPSRQALDLLKCAGVALMMDDFGTGWSSLARLQALPFDGLKIDRSFVTGLPQSEPTVAAMLRLAASLGMRTVVEGIETSKQLERFCPGQCNEVQGFHIGRPVPANALVRPQRRSVSRPTT